MRVTVIYTIVFRRNHVAKRVINMDIDRNTGKILEMLESAGFEAYMVGGCVRDMMMGRIFHDTDITTNARPDEVAEVFSGYRIIPTGIKHGTVTVLSEGVPYEITTYRIDGEYTDSRRPDSVEFTRNIADDLSRRDFTVNAMAVDRHGNTVDLFGGKEDIENKVIRCVGSPQKRFEEDALRIMRAVRFASQLGFSIEENTSKAVHEMKGRLKNISRERVRDELDKIICGKDCIRVLMEYSDVITEIIPEFKACIGFEQHSPYHKYTVWEHIVRALGSAPADNLNLRRTLLFHDIAKPVCAKFDENGRGHFKGHDEAGAEMTRKIMKNLRYDGKSTAYAVMLIANHSKKVKNRIDVKKMMSGIGDELFFELMELKKCDNLGKNPEYLYENKLYDELIKEGYRILAKNECRGFRNLAVSGTDLLRMGLEGKEIGTALNEILNLVIEEKLLNDKSEIIKYAQQRWKK